MVKFYVFEGGSVGSSFDDCIRQGVREGHFFSDFGFDDFVELFEVLVVVRFYVGELALLEVFGYGGCD